MKVIIAGSRSISDKDAVYTAIEKSGFEITEVVCGMAAGVDRIGLAWAKEHDIPVKEFPAEWGKHGAAAGPVRNEAMAKYAGGLILVWDGQSKGSRSMKKLAKQYKLRIYEVIL